MSETESYRERKTERDRETDRETEIDRERILLCLLFVLSMLFFKL